MDLANLQRQVLYDTGDLGRDKVEVAVERLARLNPDCRITPVLCRLADDELGVLARRCDIVVDASDNFDTRYAINRACLCAGKPLVSGAAVRFEGQVMVLRPVGVPVMPASIPRSPTFPSAAPTPASRCRSSESLGACRQWRS